MQKRVPIQSGELDYKRIDDKDFNKFKVETLIRALKKGMPMNSACDLAQLKLEQLNYWMEEYDDFGILVRCAKASFLEKLFDSLNDKAHESANAAIRFFSEVRKMEKDAKEDETENEIADDLYEIINEMDK